MSTAVNIASILPALNQLAAVGLRQQFELEDRTYAKFGEGTAPFVNDKGWRIPSFLRPPTGVGGISEGGSFKQPSAMTNDDMYVSANMNMVMPFEITGTALRNLSDESSLIKGLKGQLQYNTLQLKKECNRQMYNDGSAQRGIFK